MLELIGLIALIYVAVKYFPDIMLFGFKVVIVLIGLWLTLGFIGFLFDYFHLPVVIYLGDS